MGRICAEKRLYTLTAGGRAGGHRASLLGVRRRPARSPAVSTDGPTRSRPQLIDPDPVELLSPTPRSRSLEKPLKDSTENGLQARVKHSEEEKERSSSWLCFFSQGFELRRLGFFSRINIADSQENVNPVKSSKRQRLFCSQKIN